MKTFESSSRGFQLQCSIMQQLPPSDQVLFSKHLTTLHPHDGLTVSATGEKIHPEKKNWRGMQWLEYTVMCCYVTAQCMSIIICTLSYVLFH